MVGLGIEWFKTAEMSPGTESNINPEQRPDPGRILLRRSYTNAAIYSFSMGVNISCFQWRSKCSTQQHGLLGIGEFSSSCVLMYMSFAVKVRVQAGHFDMNEFMCLIPKSHISFLFFYYYYYFFFVPGQ